MNQGNKLITKDDLFKRYEKNPILTTDMWPYRANTVFNPGATLYNNETLLLVRVEEMNGFSHLTKAISKDGKTNWHIDGGPTLHPDPASHPEEIWGIEDARIVFLEEPQEYAVTYTAFSKRGPLVSLALTTDFQNFRRQGLIMPPEDKDASLFPRKIGGRWALIHRPVTVFPGNAHMWISFSPDLKYWGDYSIIMEAKKGGWWDAGKIGLGPQPIETSEGWLILYHGVRRTAAGCIYRVGLALLDLDDPRKVIRRCTNWVFGPRESYETIGDVPYVVFPCGMILDDASGELRIYYGAADSCVGLATAKLQDVLDYIKLCI
jgi:beta-1,4-mannooligosaccharide/beta-1,4-mannosyl-N-acetylglucosamine phosphorylase